MAEDTLGPTEMAAHQSPAQAKLLKYALFVLAGLLLLGSITCAGYWWGTKSASTKTLKLAFPTQTLVPTLTPTPTSLIVTTAPASDSTVDWRTYTNKDLGFSIKYPQNWFYKESLNYKLIFLGSFPSLNDQHLSSEEAATNGYVSIEVIENKNNLPLNNWFDEFTKCDGSCAPGPPRLLKNIVIGDKQGILAEQDLPGPLGKETKVYCFAKGKVVYHLQLYYPQPQVYQGIKCEKDAFEETFDQILSTFKFLD